MTTQKLTGAEVLELLDISKATFSRKKDQLEELFNEKGFKLISVEKVKRSTIYTIEETQINEESRFNNWLKEEFDLPYNLDFVAFKAFFKKHVLATNLTQEEQEKLNSIVKATKDSYASRLKDKGYIESYGMRFWKRRLDGRWQEVSLKNYQAWNYAICSLGLDKQKQTEFDALYMVSEYEVQTNVFGEKRLKVLEGSNQ